MARSRVFKTCIDCGERFETALGSRSVRCPSCKDAYIKKYKRKYESERWKKEKEKRRLELIQYPNLIRQRKQKYVKKDPYTCKRKRECYYGDVAGVTPICNYLQITGVRRPCSVEDCYMFKRKDESDGRCEK